MISREAMEEMRQERLQEQQEEHYMRSDWDYFYNKILADDIDEIEDMIHAVNKKLDDYGWNLQYRLREIQ